MQSINLLYKQNTDGCKFICNEWYCLHQESLENEESTNISKLEDVGSLLCVLSRVAISEKNTRLNDLVKSWKTLQLHTNNIKSNP